MKGDPLKFDGSPSGENNESSIKPIIMSFFMEFGLKQAVASNSSRYDKAEEGLNPNSSQECSSTRVL